jgi:cobalt-zinc-cadmium efflux system protein
MPHGGHDHHHDHHHGGHGHSHAPARYDTAFALGVGLNAVLVAAQIAFGLLAGSLALIADAGHNFADVLGLVMAWWATVLGRRPPSGRRTYGYGRVSILASLSNAVLLLIGVGAIVLEAVRRFMEPEPVAGATVMWVAAAGIVINGFTAWLFMSGRKSDVNIRGAFLHLAADAVVSLGVVIAAGLIVLTGWVWLDPVMSLVIAVVITAGTWSLLRESIELATDVMPSQIDRTEVEGYLTALPGVTEVHDLHVWNLSTTEIALTVHLVRPGCGPDDGLLHDTAHELKHRFGIGHATFQVESGDGTYPCALAPGDVV